MSDHLPDSVVFKHGDPEVNKAMNDPEQYRAYKARLAAENPPSGDAGTPPPPSGQTDPETPPESKSNQPEPSPDPSPAPTAAPPAEPSTPADPPAGKKDTPPESPPSGGESSEQPALTEEDARVLQKHKIIDADGKFFSKYDSVDKMLHAIAHKDKVISSKFGDWVKKNPDLARELLIDAGAISESAPAIKPEPGEGKPPAAGKPKDGTPKGDPPPDGKPADGKPDGEPPDPGSSESTPPPAQPVEVPTPTADVDALVDRSMNIDAILESEFGNDLDEIGMKLPTTREEWRKLGDMSPGLYNEVKERYNALSEQREQTRSVLRHAAQQVENRRAQRGDYEKDLLAKEREALIANGYPEDLITKAEEGLLKLRQDDVNVDLNYFDDADGFGNRLFVPVLREGALTSFLHSHHIDDIVDARASRIADEKLNKQIEYRKSKEARAGLFPPSIAAQSGKGRERTMLSHPTPSPTEYWDQGWRDQHLRTQQARDAVKRWIDSLPADQKNQYRHRPG